MIVRPVDVLHIDADELLELLDVTFRHWRRPEAPMAENAGVLSAGETGQSAASMPLATPCRGVARSSTIQRRIGIRPATEDPCTSTLRGKSGLPSYCRGTGKQHARRCGRRPPDQPELPCGPGRMLTLRARKVRSKCASSAVDPLVFLGKVRKCARWLYPRAST